MVTRVKMEVTPDLSERIQEIVFANGGIWFTSNKKIQHLDKHFMFIDKRRILSISNNEKFFKSSCFEEISPYDFIASQGEQKWLPKYGEEVFFSNDNKTWEKDKFICYEPGYKNYYVCDWYRYKYKYCKQLPEPVSFIQFLKDNQIYEEYLYNSKIENQRWLCKINYKTIEEIKKLNYHKWIKHAFNWQNQKKDINFWWGLNDKWEEICENNKNIVWGNKNEYL